MILPKNNNDPPDWLVETTDNDRRGIKRPLDCPWKAISINPAEFDYSEWARVSCFCGTQMALRATKYIVRGSFNLNYAIGQCPACLTIYWMPLPTYKK
jgi:hypothetical protein